LLAIAVTMLLGALFIALQLWGRPASHKIR